MGPVDYNIRQPERRKKEQIYHVNLLKPWKNLDTVLMSNVTETEEANAQVSKINIGPSCLKYRRRRMCFLHYWGKTNVITHDIVTDHGVKVKLIPYRVPEAKKAEISAEVHKMLQLGVIGVFQRVD